MGSGLRATDWGVRKCLETNIVDFGRFVGFVDSHKICCRILSISSF